MDNKHARPETYDENLEAEVANLALEVKKEALMKIQEFMSDDSNADLKSKAAIGLVLIENI